MKSGRSLTFAELEGELDRTAAALRLAGLKPGDRAALFVATGIEFVVLVNACFQAGVVPVLIDPGMGAKNVLSCVREQRPAGLIGVLKAQVLRAVFRGAFASVRHAGARGRWLLSRCAVADPPHGVGGGARPRARALRR